MQPRAFFKYLSIEDKLQRYFQQQILFVLLTQQVAHKDTLTLCLKISKAENCDISYKDLPDFPLGLAIQSIHQICFSVCLLAAHDEYVISLALPANRKIAYVASEFSFR